MKIQISEKTYQNLDTAWCRDWPTFRVASNDLGFTYIVTLIFFKFDGSERNAYRTTVSIEDQHGNQIGSHTAHINFTSLEHCNEELNRYLHLAAMSAFTDANNAQFRAQLQLENAQRMIKAITGMKG